MYQYQVMLISSHHAAGKMSVTKFGLLLLLLVTTTPMKLVESQGQACTMDWDEQLQKFVEPEDFGCGLGHSCLVEDDVSVVDGRKLQGNGNGNRCVGQCVTEQCGGSNGNGPPGEGSTRVTICHRTCSATNPWVRITIDDDAWHGQNAEHCHHTTDRDHQQHNVDEDCSAGIATGPNDAWGTNRADYLLHYHGTRQEVRAANGWAEDSVAERGYWDNWERACPSVRNGDCCSWTQPEIYGACCGDNPIKSPNVAPTEPPVPYGHTFAPVTVAPNAAPVAQATPAPQSVTTPAPQAVVTPAPAATQTDVPAGNGECRRRRQLQNGLTLAEKWNIEEPTFDYDSLSFDLDLGISTFISDRDMVQYKLFDESCTVEYTGSSLQAIKSNFKNIDTQAKTQNVEINVNIDSTSLATDNQVYYEGPDTIINGEQHATVNFCVRFGLHTPIEAGDDEVNFLEVIVKLKVDLTDGFAIDTVSVASLDPCEKEAQEAFEVEGYFCERNAEAIPLEQNAVPVMNQGAILRVCVRPVQRARALFVRMRSLKDFTWRLTNSNIQQKAIENYAPAENGLTNVWCTRGYGICHFETILYSAFYRQNGVVTGSGTADLQFGGESNQDSVSPRSRRRLRQIGRHDGRTNRDLQQNESTFDRSEFERSLPGSTVEYEMTVYTERTSRDGTMLENNDSNNGGSRKLRLYLLMAVLLVLACVMAFVMFPELFEGDQREDNPTQTKLKKNLRHKSGRDEDWCESSTLGTHSVTIPSVS